MPDPSKQKLIKLGIRLEYLTLGWNVIGVIVVLLSAVSARSIALAGFGFDSLIEIFASIIVVWQLKRINKDKEHFAERLIGLAFLALALYISVQIIYVILIGAHPKHSTIGIIWLSFTALAMLVLAHFKKRTGDAIPNIVLQTESKVTVIDGLLALAVLIGLVMNSLFGLWYADLISAGVIVYYGLKEGITALKY